VSSRPVAGSKAQMVETVEVDDEEAAVPEPARAPPPAAGSSMLNSPSYESASRPYT